MRVTVYILNHNQWRYLDQAIRSVVDQTYKNIELILVDNNSAEQATLLPAFAEKHSFDKVLCRSDANLKRAANEVLEVASGDYILRLDADDFLHESAIAIMVEKAIAKSADFVSSDYFFVSEGGEIKGQFYKNSLIDFAKRPDVPMHGACCLISRAFLSERGGYNVDVLMQDGFDVWLALSGSARGEHINLPLFSYRRHANNLSNDSDRLIEARRALLATHVAEVPGYCLAYFTRKMIDKAAEDAAALHSAIAENKVVAPIELIIFCAGETTEIVDRDLAGGPVRFMVRADPEMLKKNAVEQCLADYDRQRAIGAPFVACLYDVRYFLPELLAGALRSAIAFEADIVHSVRRETMNLYFHDGVGLKPLSENLSFTDERSIIFKRYPVCDVYRTGLFRTHGPARKIGHFLLKSGETSAEVNHGWDIA